MRFLTNQEKNIKFTAAGLSAIQSIVLIILTVIYLIVDASGKNYDNYVFLYVTGSRVEIFGLFIYTFEGTLAGIPFLLWVLIYLLLNTAWLIVSVLVLRKTKIINERIFLVLWSIVTSVVCVLDFVTVVLVGIDYDRCVNTHYYSIIATPDICSRGILPVLFLAAKGFVLWIVNFIMAIVLFRFSKKWVQLPESYLPTGGNVLMPVSSLSPQPYFQSSQPQLQTPQTHLQSPQFHLQSSQPSQTYPQQPQYQVPFQLPQPYPPSFQDMQNQVYVVQNRSNNQRTSPSVQENEDIYVPPIDYVSSSEVSSHLYRESSTVHANINATFNEPATSHPVKSISPNHPRLIEHSSSASANNRQHYSESTSIYANPGWIDQPTSSHSRNVHYGVTSRMSSSARPSTPNGYYEATTRVSYASTPGVKKIAPIPPPKPRRYPN